MAITKLEGSDIWEGVNVTDKKAEYDSALASVQNWIIANLPSIKLSFECWEGEFPATMRELQLAVTTARLEDLVSFQETGRLPLEDGYLTVSV